nr:hypothetical protein BaRGS_007791 [Batillaria attramentaria]
MQRLFLVALVFSAACGTVEGNVLNWERLILEYGGQPVRVSESATVDPKNEKILVSATDIDLRGTPFYRSESLLDFKTGLVAIKPLASTICLIAPILDTLDNTIKTLDLRDGVTLETEGLRTQLLIDLDNPLTDLGSTVLEQFCVGLDLVKLNPVVDTVLDTVNHIRWAPLSGVLGPLDIFISVGNVALNGIPIWLLNWCVCVCAGA